MTLTLTRPEYRLGMREDSRWFGVFVGVVVDVVDPDGQGQVRVQLPWAHDTDGTPFEGWCRLVVPMAGASRGVWFVPEVDDEVAVVFEAGDPRRPFVVGSLWNGSDAPPESMDGSGQNNIRSIHSRSGIRIVMDDTDGAVALTVDTPGGQSLEMHDGGSTVTVQDANGNRVELAVGGITIETSAKLTISASTVEVTAGQVTVNAGISKFSGVVQADTVIANTVVGTSYTPGAGNIW
jgi:uncharacterized protein involved in type VI secretion and phage assembly